MIRLVIGVAADINPPLPVDAFDRIRARRATGDRTILPVGDEPHAPATPGSWRRRSVIVTLLLLGLAGTAAAFATGPIQALLRVWQQRWTAAEPPRIQPTLAPADSSADSSASVVPMSGVSLPAFSSEELWVSVENADPSLRIRFRLTDGTDVEVRGTGSATAAVFSPRRDGVGVANAGPGELQVDVPRSVRQFVLRVDGVPYLAKRGSELRVLSTKVDTTGSDLVLTPSHRRGDGVAAPSPKR